MSDSGWAIKGWTELGIVVAILGSVVSGIAFVVHKRAAAVASLREALVGDWTNEGDVSPSSSPFIDLQITDTDSGLVGTLAPAAIDERFDVIVRPGFASADLQIVRLSRGTLQTTGTVRLRKISGARQFQWTYLGNQVPPYLPKSAIIWPTPIASDSNKR